MQIKVTDHSRANVPVLAVAHVTAIDVSARLHKEAQHELPTLARRVSSTARSAPASVRATLSRIPAATADTSAPRPEASRVMGRVFSGERVLHNRYEPANLRAATHLAASGLAMLRRLQAPALR